MNRARHALSPAGREHGAGDDQREAEAQAQREGLAEQDDAEDEGNGGIDVGDDGRPHGADLADQGEEHDETGQRRPEARPITDQVTSAERCAGRLENAKGA